MSERHMMALLDLDGNEVGISEMWDGVGEWTAPDKVTVASIRWPHGHISYCAPVITAAPGDRITFRYMKGLHMVSCPEPGDDGDDERWPSLG
jgi:plastocyanin